MNAESNIEAKREIFYSRKVLPFVLRFAFVTACMEAAQALAKKKNDRLTAKNTQGLIRAETNTARGSVGTIISFRSCLSKCKEIPTVEQQNLHK
jgi:hypothetical protein